MPNSSLSEKGFSDKLSTKSEYRNPKQYQNLKHSMTKTQMFWNFGASDFEFAIQLRFIAPLRRACFAPGSAVSDFVLRISDFRAETLFGQGLAGYLTSQHSECEGEN